VGKGKGKKKKRERERERENKRKKDRKKQSTGIRRLFVCTRGTPGGKVSAADLLLSLSLSAGV